MKSFFDLFKKPETKDTPKKIISFDGGGVRAIAGIVFLNEFEKATGKKVSDVFDMFIGTSAGSLNAACFAAESMHAQDIKKYWSEDYLNKIMQTSFFWDKASLVQARPRYESKGRVRVLKEIFGNKNLGQSEKPILTLCYDVEERRHVIHTSNLTPEISIVDAISASSAAPMYFPTYQMTQGSWMVDGSIVTNNPTMLGLIHARNYFQTNDIKVLSIGVGQNTKKINGEASANWGGVGWLRNDIIGMVLDSEIHNEIASGIIDKNYLRINSPLNKINKMLDDSSAENIEKIHLMGLMWWDMFGNELIKFLED
jgi:patatin-like phospholipase/acyl hydrolase